MYSLVSAVVVGAAGFFFLASVPANAMRGDQRDVPGRSTGSAQTVKVLAVENPGIAADNSAMCAKCHSACENGRSHEGRVTVNKPDAVELPLDDEGRTTCTTCHDTGNHGAQGDVGSHLRVSNLRRELCLACHRQDDEAVPRVEIISPLERAVVQEERLALIGRASRFTGPDLTVRLNGAEFHLHVKGGEFSTWLRLQAGVNRVEVAQGERLLWKGEVFQGESPMGGYGRSSSGHRTGNRAQCLECHLKMDEMRSGVAGFAPALCYDCHDRNDQKRYVHGPLAVGDCLACHDPHGGYGSAHLRQEQTLLCGNCHAVRESVAMMTCKTTGKGCVECHDPHQSDTRYLLKGPQTTMRENFLARR